LSISAIPAFEGFNVQSDFVFNYSFTILFVGPASPLVLFLCCDMLIPMPCNVHLDVGAAHHSFHLLVNDQPRQGLAFSQFSTQKMAACY